MRRHGRRRRKKRDQGTVVLNLAAMLDMAFQLLAFFILTFRPAPIEGQLALNMPPPEAVITKTPNANSDGTIGDVLSQNTLHVHVMATEAGDANEVKVEETPVTQGHFDEANRQRLDKSLKSRFAGATVPYDRVQVNVDGRLRYGELMKIIDVCHNQELPDHTPMRKISFSEIDSGGAK